MDELKMIGELLTEERPASMATEAQARRKLEAAVFRKRGRRKFVVVAGVAAVAVAGGVYYQVDVRPLYKPEPLAGQSGPAASFLLAAADAKEKAIKDGKFWYTRSVFGTSHNVRALRDPKVRYSLQVSEASYGIAGKTEHSLGKDWSSEGGPIVERRDPGRNERTRPASEKDAAAWEADGKPRGEAFGLVTPSEPRRGPDVGEGAQLDFGVEEARKLPADPAKLRAWLLNYATKFDRKRLRNPDLYLFARASDLLVGRPVDDRVRVATYRILASLDGVRYITATDAEGRKGRGVAMRHTTPELGTMEWQLIIDGATGRLTASQGVVITPGTENAQLQPGTRQFFEVVEKAEWTNASPESLRPKSVSDMYAKVGSPGD